MRRFGLLGVLLVGLLSVTLLRPARAVDEEVHLTFDDPGGDDLAYDLSPYDQGVLGSGRTGNGMNSTYNGFNGTFYNYQLIVNVQLPEDCAPTHLYYWHEGNDTTISNYGDGYQVRDADDELVQDFTFTGANTVFDTWQEESIDLSGIAGDAVGGHILILVGFGALSEDAGNYTKLDDIQITCGEGGGGGGLTRPIAAQDEDPDFGMFDYAFVHATHSEYQESFPVEAFSANFGANVAAVASGTVLSVTPYTVDDCQDNIAVLPNLYFVFENIRWCTVAIPGPISDNTFSQTYSLEMVNNWRVVVEDGVDSSITYEYILTNPSVKVGDVVAAGCILGQTIQLKQLATGIFQFAFTIGSLLGISGDAGFLSNPTDAGVTLVTMFEAGEEGTAPVSLYPNLTEQPTLDDCEARRLSACVNANPSITGFSYYERASDVSLLDGGKGASVPPFNYLTQSDIMIDPDVDYSLSIQARQRSAGGDEDLATVNIQLGSELQSFPIATGFANYTFTPETDDWHTDNLTSLFISNQPDSVNSVEINYICLAPVTASTAPGSCYFANNEFDADGSGWDLSATTFGTGQAFMRDGSYINQAVTLMPDTETSHTYTIRAVARLIATGSYTGQIGKSVTLNYKFPDEGPDFTEVGTIDSTLVTTQGMNAVSGLVEFDYPYTLETTIEITAETSSDFVFEVEVEDEDDFIQGIRLDSVCIDPEGDGSFPGQDGSGGYTPPFVVGCSVVPTPSENSIGPWIFYHWANLRRFFNCDLMKLLNKWFAAFDSFRKTILQVARWWIVLVHKGSSWLTSFIWWLNGSFRNVAMGQVTTITDSGGCHDIFCAITDVVTTLANLLTPIVAALNNVVNVLVGVFVGVVNLFFTLIGGLVAFVVALLIKLMSFIGIAISLLTGLVGAYNGSTPTSIPGLPTCAIDPSSSLLCLPLWVADNTIFQGRWNTLMLIIISILSIHIILYTIGNVKKIVLETWGSS